MGGVPDSIPAGENTMAEVTVANAGDGIAAGIRVTVNGIEMSETARYLGETTVPVGVFGGDAEELTTKSRSASRRNPSGRSPTAAPSLSSDPPASGREWIVRWRESHVRPANGCEIHFKPIPDDL